MAWQLPDNYKCVVCVPSQAVFNYAVAYIYEATRYTNELSKAQFSVLHKLDFFAITTAIRKAPVRDQHTARM